MAGHPIDPLLDDWARDCRRDGFDLRARVYRCLAEPTRWTRERLRAALRAVLAFGPAERAAFDACFDRHFDATIPWEPWLTELAAWDRERALADLRAAVADETAPRRPTPDASNAVVAQPPAEPVGRPTASTSPVDSAPSPTEATPSPAPRAWGPVVLLVGALLFVIALLARPPSPPPPRPSQDAAAVVVADAGPRDTGPRDASAMVVSDEIGPVSQGTVLRLEAVTPHDEARPWWRRALRHVGFALVGAIAVWEVLLLFDLLARWRAARPARFEVVTPPVYRDKNARERTLDLRSPWPLAEPFEAGELDALAWRVGFSDDHQRPVLDVAASIVATARNGGLVDVVCRAGRSPSTLGVSRPTSLDPIARHLLDALERGMKARGVRVEDVAAGVPCDLTLVFVDASEFVREPGERARVEDALRRPHVALVELRDPGLWDDTLQALPRAPATFDARGLAEALDAARTERPLPRPRARAAGGDRERLGRAAPLAVACALCEPFDLPVMDALRRRFTPALGFLAMQRVLGLDGVPRLGDHPVGLTMTAALRAWLLQPGRCDCRFEAEVLRWQRERLAQTPCPEGSRAEAKRAQEMAWLTLRIAACEGATLSAEATAAFAAVMAAQSQHPTLAKLRDVRRAEVGEEAVAALAVEGDELPIRTLREQLAAAGITTHDPVTLAWPTRWPRLALESVVGAVALAGAVVAVATLEEPRTSMWSAEKSREVGSAEGRAFAKVCAPGSSIDVFGRGEGLYDGAICGLATFDGRSQRLSRAEVISDGLPKFLHVTTVERQRAGTGPLRQLRTRSFRGGYTYNSRGEIASLQVTGVDSTDAISTKLPPLRDHEDFLLDCGPNREMCGIFGHVSADGRRVTGFGVYCCAVVEHGRAGESGGR